VLLARRTTRAFRPSPCRLRRWNVLMVFGTHGIDVRWRLGTEANEPVRRIASHRSLFIDQSSGRMRIRPLPLRNRHTRWRCSSAWTRRQPANWRQIHRRPGLLRQAHALVIHVESTSITPSRSTRHHKAVFMDSARGVSPSIASAPISGGRLFYGVDQRRRYRQRLKLDRIRRPRSPSTGSEFPTPVVTGWILVPGL
jgi:hypothetical protein